LQDDCPIWYSSSMTEQEELERFRQENKALREALRRKDEELEQSQQANQDLREGLKQAILALGSQQENIKGLQGLINSLDQCANPSGETIQRAKGRHFVTLFDEFFESRIDHIRRVVHRAHRTQECAEDNPACLFAIGKDLIVLAHYLVMTIQRPIMVIPGNNFCAQVECLTNIAYQR